MGEAERGWVIDRLAAAAGVLEASGEVRIRLVGDEEMDAAHRRFGNVPGTTDVLTFDLRDGGDADGPLDVDLLVCVDEARRQGEARGHGATKEVLLYALHGLLHCLGETDSTDEASARMHAREDRVLEAIGVGAVFAGTAHSTEHAPHIGKGDGR